MVAGSGITGRVCVLSIGLELACNEYHEIMRISLKGDKCHLKDSPNYPHASSSPIPRIIATLHNRKTGNFAMPTGCLNQPNRTRKY